MSVHIFVRCVAGSHHQKTHHRPLLRRTWIWTLQDPLKWAAVGCCWSRLAASLWTMSSPSSQFTNNQEAWWFSDVTKAQGQGLTLHPLDIKCSFRFYWCFLLRPAILTSGVICVFCKHISPKCLNQKVITSMHLLLTAVMYTVFFFFYNPTF